jgi:hypothetical protein
MHAQLRRPGTAANNTKCNPERFIIGKSNLYAICYSSENQLHDPVLMNISAIISTSISIEHARFIELVVPVELDFILIKEIDIFIIRSILFSQEK